MAQTVKISACNADLGSVSELGRSSGEGHRNPCQYSCLENSMGRGTWQATVHGVTELDTTEWLTLSLSPPFVRGKSLQWLVWGMGMWQPSQRGTSQVLLVDFLERKGFLIPKKEAHEKMAPLEPWISCGWIWLLPLWPSGHTWSHSQHAKESTKKQETSLNYCIK